MIKYVLVQSLSSFNFSKKIFKKQIKDIVWLTTCPYMHNYFKKENYKFFNLENFSNLDDYNIISKNLIKIFSDFKKLSIINYDKNFDDNYYFEDTFNSLSTTIFYKYFLINNFIKNKKHNEKIIFIGNSNYEKNLESRIQNPVSSLYYNRRFSDLFCKIALRSFPNIEVINFEENSKLIINKIKEVKETSMNIYEIILSLLNNNISSILFKIAKKLNKKKIIKKIKFFFIKKKTQVVIHNTTDHIEELFLNIICKGYEVVFFPNINNLKLTKPKWNEKEINIKRINFFKKKIINNLKDKIDYFPNYEDAIEDLLKFHTYLSLEYLANEQFLNSYFSKLFSKYDKNHIFLSKCPYSKIDILYHMFLKKKKIKTIFSEHGISYGISKAYKYRNNFYSMIKSDVGWYYWNYSKQAVKFNAKKQKKINVGFPLKVTIKNFKKLKKILIQKILKSSNNSICYVADLEKNNFMIGPYFENDLYYYKSTREIVSYLCKKYPNKKIYLKLYPTNRYVNNYDFTDMKKIYPNLNIIRFIDFRFLREVFNEIYISSSQSTLGWALGTSAKIFYVEKKYGSVLMLKGLKKRIDPSFKFIRYIVKLKNVNNLRSIKKFI